MGSPMGALKVGGLEAANNGARKNQGRVARSRALDPTATQPGACNGLEGPGALRLHSQKNRDPVRARDLPRTRTQGFSLPTSGT